MHTPSSSTSLPRPILKHHESSPNYGRAIGSLHAVHFPPSPALTRTYSAYPSSAYDRSPIVVAPNTCALPERGCPGRTYTLEGEGPVSSAPISKRTQNGIHIHPRAVFNHQSPVSPSKLGGTDDGSQRPSRRYSLPQPPLIPDLSSESDESDGFTSPPLDLYNPALKPAPSIPWPHTRGDASVFVMTPPYQQYSYPNGGNVPSTASFLPYPPCPEDKAKGRRRKQKSDRSCDPERGRKSGTYSMDGEADDRPCDKPLPLTRYGGFSTFALESEESCLGGF